MKDGRGFGSTAPEETEMRSAAELKRDGDEK